jgi:hypothetical protein
MPVLALTTSYLTSASGNQSRRKLRAMLSLDRTFNKIVHCLAPYDR